LVDLVAVAINIVLRLKHRSEKRVTGRFLFNALARAHLDRIATLQRITNEIDNKLQLHRVGRLGDLQVQVRCNDLQILHQLALLLLEFHLHSNRRQFAIDLLEQLLLTVVVMLQEQKDEHRHQVERQLVISYEAFHDLEQRAKERRHTVNGMPFQVKENAMANVGRILVHDAIQNNALARSVGAHLVSRVPTHGQALVCQLLASNPSWRAFDAILLPHDFAAMDSSQCIPQLLSGLLNERQHLEHSELDGVVGAPDVVDLAHLFIADEGID